MKTTLSLCLLTGLMCGCASFTDAPAQQSKKPDNVFSPKLPANTKIAAGKTGEMAYAVERLAKENGCELYEKASLIAKRPGIQFYRVSCADGRNILYRCETRQCRVAD